MTLILSAVQRCQCIEGNDMALVTTSTHGCPVHGNPADAPERDMPAAWYCPDCGQPEDAPGACRTCRPGDRERAR